MAERSVIELVYRLEDGRDTIEVPSSHITRTEFGVNLNWESHNGDDEYVSWFFPWDSVRAIKQIRPKMQVRAPLGELDNWAAGHRTV
jgi:hypothetical protein